MPSVIKWGDVVVPYTAMWSAEVERREPGVQWQMWGGNRLRMLSEGVDDRSGKPVFNMLHADRCREVIRGGLCQMCVRPLPAEVVVVNQGQVDGRRPLISDGLPMCPRCAAAAFWMCPGMQRQAASGVLRLWRALRGAWYFAPVILGVVPESAGGDERLNVVLRRANGLVFTGPKLVVTLCQRVMPADLAALTDA